MNEPTENEMDMPERLRCLIAARKKIERPEAWMQNNLSVDEYGLPCDVDSERACAFCTIGAVKSVNAKKEAEHEALCALYDNIRTGQEIEDWNDANTRTHAEVLALFDRTIEEMKQELQ